MEKKEALAIGDSVRSQTGYGRVSQHVFSYFAKKGWHITQIGWHHSEPPERVMLVERDNTANPPKDVITGVVDMFPAHTKDEFAVGSTLLHLNTGKHQMVYNSNDIFTNVPLVANRKLLTHPMFLVNYGVIDAPDVAKIFRETIEEIDVLVVPSKFGHKQVVKVKKDALYIPHGVDTWNYRPYTEAQRQEARDGFQMGNKFVFGTINRNITRKLYPYIFESFANLKYRHKLKDIMLFMIGDPKDEFGYDLFALAKHYKLKMSWLPSDKPDILIHPQHLNWVLSVDEAHLPAAYNAMHVLVSATMAEGFGLTTIEAQACGVPVIIPDHSANTELVKGHGYLYPTVKNEDKSEVLFPARVGGVLYAYPVPDRAALEREMLHAYKNRTVLEQNGKAAHEFAQDYEWKKVLPAWDEVLSRVEQFWDKHGKEEEHKDNGRSKKQGRSGKAETSVRRHKRDRK